MKKDTPAPEQHPVDAFFREQEPNIPVTFDPAHWDALQVMLDQSVPGGTSVSGAHASDPDASSVRPAIGRFIRMVLVVAFLAALPSANPASQQAFETAIPEDNATGEAPATLQMTPIPDARTTPLNQDVDGRIESAAGAAIGQSPDWSLFSKTNATSIPLNADTLVYHSLMPGMVVDSLLRQTDSLSILKSLNAAQDSVAVKRKKKKHLFW